MRAKDTVREAMRGRQKMIEKLKRTKNEYKVTLNFLRTSEISRPDLWQNRRNHYS